MISLKRKNRTTKKILMVARGRSLLETPEDELEFGPDDPNLTLSLFE
jgi:hypothetical protein